MKRAVLLAFLGVACVWAQDSRGETIECTEITSLPATITQQGVYCLKRHLSTNMASGNAITINTNNVTIDCNGYRIGGLAAGAGTRAHGIHAGDRMNLTVRNCLVRGFFRGLVFDGAELSSGHSVENNIFDGNTYLGIRIQGDGVRVAGNRVINTGGTDDPNGAYGGIVVHGDGPYLVDNHVSGVYHDQFGEWLRGILVNGSRGIVENNRVTSLLPGTGAMGIWLSGPLSGPQHVLRNNVILVPAGTIGFPVFSHSDSNICRGNIVSGFDADWLASQSPSNTLCQDAGQNTGLAGGL